MAAGLGFKTFNTGEVLTAADTNGYLMQGVLVFADAAARDAAITLPQEGQIAYLKSDDAIYKYTGATWTNIDTSGSPAVNKNYLINGGFAISQRGTTFASGANNDDAYTLDRWYILSDTNDVIDVTQNTTTVPTNGQFAIALDVETVNKKFGIASIIENKDVIGLVGNTVTFSFKAKVSSTTKLDNVKAAIVAWSGTADTVTSDIISAWGAEGTNPTLIANATYENSPTNLNLTTSYATYSISAAVDTASTTNLILFVWSDVTDTTAGDFLYIAEAKLELGSSATSFEYAGGTLAGELAACQRYYFELPDGLQQVGFGRRSNATTLVYSVPVATTMRTSPSVTYTGSVLYEGGGAGSSGTLSSPSVSLNRANIIVLTATTSGTPVTGEAYVVDSGKHTFSAEL